MDSSRFIPINIAPAALNGDRQVLSEPSCVVQNSSIGLTAEIAETDGIIEATVGKTTEMALEKQDIKLLSKQKKYGCGHFAMLAEMPICNLNLRLRKMERNMPARHRITIEPLTSFYSSIPAARFRSLS